MLNIKELKYRKEPVKHTEILIKNKGNNVVNSEKTKLYNYYICDYCGDKIRLDKKQHERSGGTATFPHTLTKCGELKLALCNKCIKKAVKELEGATNERN